MRILIVDTSKVARNIVKNVLGQMEDCEIREAADGADALSKAVAFDPDLVVLEHNLPTLDGVKFARTFRAHGRTAPMLMVTGESEKDRVMGAIAAGITDYLVKPFTPETLIRRVREMLAKAHSTAPLAGWRGGNRPI